MMTEELKKIEFNKLRNKMVKDSCMEVKNKKLNLRNYILTLLEADGYNRNHPGTKYLATLIEIFYHERKLYLMNDNNYKEYWNLDDWDNEHYSMLGNTKQNVLNAILSAIGTNHQQNIKIDELVYEMVYMADFNYNKHDIRVKYQKLLNK